MTLSSKPYLLCLPLFLTLAGCTHNNISDSPITQLQVRETQTRDFDTDDTKMVMKSMMNVLQDDGFIIKNAVLDLGLLSAEKNVNTENNVEAFLQLLVVRNDARWEKYQLLEASANISSFGDKTRVRMSFQTKAIDNFGCPKEVTTITNLEYYQNFFEKVSKGLFLQKENI